MYETMRNDSWDRDVHQIAASFQTLVDHFRRLLTLHAGEAEVVGPLERVEAHARHGLQLSANSQLT